jgi:hypothetical protein
VVRAALASREVVVRPATHRQQGQHGQGQVVDQHRDDEREGKQDSIPGLDGKLAHTHAQHLDITDNACHHVASRGAVQPSHRPGNDAAPRIRPDIGPDPGVGRHEPPALDNTGDFGEQCAAHEGQSCPAHSVGAHFTPFKRPRRVDSPAQQDRRQYNGGVHDDTGNGAEHELSRHLPEVRAHLPEIVTHRR